VNYRFSAVKTYFETKSIMKTQRRFRREFDDPRHGRIRALNVVIRISVRTSASLIFSRFSSVPPGKFQDDTSTTHDAFIPNLF
jgi:hypothetical protein